MNFNKEKQDFLKKPDKSLAGGIDKAILPLVNKINKSDFYYTKSSCAGRILLMPETGKKQENVFLAVWHDKITFNELKKSLKNSIEKSKLTIYLKHEPCILHVASTSLEKAIKLVNLARNSGWKKSGLISLNKNIVELVSTEILAAPVADKGEIIIDDNYIKTLISEANKKLTQTRKKIKNLERNFEI